MRASAASLTEPFGVGPIIAGTLIGFTGDVIRFANRDHYAAYNGTAPAEFSSGGRVIHRLSRRGNRRRDGHSRPDSLSPARSDGDVSKRSNRMGIDRPAEGVALRFGGPLLRRLNAPRPQFESRRSMSRYLVPADRVPRSAECADLITSNRTSRSVAGRPLRAAASGCTRRGRARQHGLCPRTEALRPWPHR